MARTIEGHGEVGAAGSYARLHIEDVQLRIRRLRGHAEERSG